MTDFTGRWQATFGPMELTQTGDHVEGYYLPGSVRCPLTGQVAGQRLTFTYQEPGVRGEGWFELAPHGQAFHGQWRADGDSTWRPWTGWRLGFDGVWATDFGTMRLAVEAGVVHGLYEQGGGSTIEGQLRANGLAFTYTEPNARGEGQFVLADDALSFEGRWRPEGAADWGLWRGRRLVPTGLTWLVVLEVAWHTIANERDYSFGGMLREFFARVNGVRVRHRFFNNEAALARLCRELWMIPDPVVLVVATHSEEQGIRLEGRTVQPRLFEESLRYVPDLRLLHFSACLLMKNADLVGAYRRLAGEHGMAVSGYSTSVNWAASAILEFTYLEMVLGYGMTPAQAAEQVGRLLTFAGDETVPGSPFAPAGFRIVTA
jgi:hypothetical protein